MAVTNIPLLIKMLCPILFLIDFIRRFIHKHVVLELCRQYHAACRQLDEPFTKEIRELLTHRHGEGSDYNPTVVEYGSGPFPALTAYPRGTRLVCIDPCPDFDSKLQEAWDKSHLAGHGILTISHRKMEDVDTDLVLDNTVDVVFSRCANCSVTNTDKTFANVHRILKPGGRYYFWDHVRSDSWIIQLIQYLMSTPFISFFSDCSLVRRPWEKLKKAGFADVKVNRFKAPLPGLLFMPYTPTATGYATK